MCDAEICFGKLPLRFARNVRLQMEVCHTYSEARMNELRERRLWTTSLPPLLARLRLLASVLSRNLLAYHAPDLIIAALFQPRVPPRPPISETRDQPSQPHPQLASIHPLHGKSSDLS
jgi:hypothetical protein